MKGMFTVNFWDIVAPLYDTFEMFNGGYRKMINKVCGLLPSSSTVLELAAGTGNYSLAVSEKSQKVLCTDISDNMLKVAKRKLKNKSNIDFVNMSIFETGLPDNSYDVVIASQVLHLLDEPEKAVVEIRRVAKNMIILPMPLLKETSGFGSFLIVLYKLFGFRPKRSFNMESYKEFIEGVGLSNCEYIRTKGSVSICVAIWRRTR